MVDICFTVLPEQLTFFQRLIEKKLPEYGMMFQVYYDLLLSPQQPNTDTIAVDRANEPFRDQHAWLVFRPGGHGALLQNLNAMDADVVFVKNIDNVVSDAYKGAMIRYKKVIAGVLVTLQKRIFDYVKLIERGTYTHKQVEEMIYFLQNELCIKNPETKYLEDAELILYIKQKLMRPLRVCAMVKNEGEPGGGPFWVRNNDGSVSLQIAESSQIDMNDPQQKAIAANATHFNPVDLICAVKDGEGRHFNLPEYRDLNTGFISKKSKDGVELKAQELPGLWNGAMAHWNTVFVEVPVETFNPVKTINDLLRPQHQ